MTEDGRRMTENGRQKAEDIKNDAVLEVENHSAWYGETHVLKDNNLRIERRKITALIGPSGCGKSTFIRCFNRMNDFIPGFRLSGKVLFEGGDLYQSNVDPIEVRTRIGMVFQKPNPFPKSIYDNIAYGPRLLGTRDRGKLDTLVESSLRKAAIWNEVKDKIKNSALALSGGQQQRLCIARALAVEPEVLLLDEPCSALDPAATSKIEDLIITLKKTYTVVIVTHNMQQASRVSDDTVFFYNGVIVEAGITKNIFTKPAKKQTEDYITGRFG